jgi:uncharacterized phiE125 gp8 family phage protein
MQKVLITPASFRPLTADAILTRPEIRGIAGDSDKQVIEDFITSAIEAYEEWTNNVLCLSTWDLLLDRFPHWRDEIITPAPLVSVTSIEYKDTSGALQTMSATDYVVDTRNPIIGRIVPAYGRTWPHTFDEANSVTAQLVAGFTEEASPLSSERLIPQLAKDGLIAFIQEMLSGIDMSGVYHARWARFQRKHI